MMQGYVSIFKKILLLNNGNNNNNNTKHIMFHLNEALAHNVYIPFLFIFSINQFNFSNVGYQSIAISYFEEKKHDKDIIQFSIYRTAKLFSRL